MITLTRILYYLYRVFNTVRFLGLNNSFKIFILSKYTNLKTMKIFLFKNNFYFRPKIDIGSYSRLTKSQYIIKGTPNQPIETIIDAGANIGSQAIRLINFNSKLKNIICIEPDVDSSKLCEKNLKNYNAKIYNNALTNTSDKDLTILKTINSEMSEIVEGSNQVIQSNNYHTIKTISINDIIKKERIDKIDFLKLDINGYEDELFEKNTEWLKITNSIGFNNADINKTTLKIISKYTEHVGKIKIYNIITSIKTKSIYLYAIF